MGAGESTLAFRKQAFQLSEQDSKEFSTEFWEAFYTIPENAEDIFNFLAHKEIRAALEKHPDNIGLLIEKLINRILLFIKKDYQEIHPPAEIKQLLNCVRILTRIFPFVFEREMEEFEEKYLWSTANEIDDKSVKPLGVQLVTAVCQLLFCKGFTLPSSPEGPMIQYVVWTKGIGATIAPDASKEEITNRVEVLRLLQVLLSKTMYLISQDKHKNRFAIEITTRLEKKAVLGMLCSFVNLLGDYDPIGIGILPYNHLIFGDTLEPLVALSLQVLIACFNFRIEELDPSGSMHPSESNESFGSLSSLQSPPTSSNSEAKNMFVFYFSKLHKEKDFEIIIAGIARLLQNPIDASQTYLPGSTKKLNFTEILFLTLWVCIGTNKKFLPYLCHSQHILAVLRALIIESLNARDNLSKIGSLRLCCFLLQIISQERSFSIQLNEAVDLKVLGPCAKALPSFSNGCWADVLFLTIYVLLTTSSSMRPHISILGESYLASLSNCAPLATKLNFITANKLHALFSMFSAPRFLLAKQRNHVRLFYLLYIVDTLLQYQYQGNFQIVYCFVRDSEKVLALRNMTLESAIEVAKSTAKRTEAETPVSDPDGTAMNSRKLSTSSTMSDKAKGKLPENGISYGYESQSGFRPTLEWFDEWKSRLPTQVLSSLVQKLGPQVENFVKKSDFTLDTKVMEYLAAQTMVGILPQPHPIITHAFVNNLKMRNWVTSYIWGTIYLCSIDFPNAEIAKLCPSSFGGTKVRLFAMTDKE